MSIFCNIPKDSLPSFLVFCDLWSECGSEVTGLRKIIWDLLFLSYSSNLMFVAIVPTALALIIFVSLSWVKNWSIKSQFDKNKGIYPWFKLDDICVSTIAKCTIYFLPIILTGSFIYYVVKILIFFDHLPMTLWKKFLYRHSSISAVLISAIFDFLPFSTTK